MRKYSGLEREGSSEICSFDKIIDLLPEEEKEQARYHFGLYRRINGVLHYPLISDFCHKLEADKGRSVRRCKLFHLYAGSTLTPEEWLELPLDTPAGDFERFARGELGPLIEETNPESEER